MQPITAQQAWGISSNNVQSVVAHILDLHSPGNRLRSNTTKLQQGFRKVGIRDLLPPCQSLSWHSVHLSSLQPHMGRMLLMSRFAKGHVNPRIGWLITWLMGFHVVGIASRASPSGPALQLSLSQATCYSSYGPACHMYGKQGGAFEAAISRQMPGATAMIANLSTHWLTRGCRAVIHNCVWYGQTGPPCGPVILSPSVIELFVG